MSGRRLSTVDLAGYIQECADLAQILEPARKDLGHPFIDALSLVATAIGDANETERRGARAKLQQVLYFYAKLKRAYETEVVMAAQRMGKTPADFGEALGLLPDRTRESLKRSYHDQLEKLLRR